MHAAGNFPFRKERSDLDVELPDGTADAAYLEALDSALDTAFTRARPELVFDVAGADPYEGDRLGKLKLTIEGLRARDARVFAAARAQRAPIVVTRRVATARTSTRSRASTPTRSRRPTPTGTGP